MPKRHSYPDRYLNSIGEHGVDKLRINIGKTPDTLNIENKIIRQYESNHGVLPPGNKMRK